MYTSISMCVTTTTHGGILLLLSSLVRFYIQPALYIMLSDVPPASLATQFTVQKLNHLFTMVQLNVHATQIHMMKNESATKTRLE